MTLEAVIRADMKRRCPEEPRAAMKRDSKISASARGELGLRFFFFQRDLGDIVGIALGSSRVASGPEPCMRTSRGIVLAPIRGATSSSFSTLLLSLFPHDPSHRIPVSPRHCALCPRRRNVSPVSRQRLRRQLVVCLGFAKTSLSTRRGCYTCRSYS
jgi:hypothetical protein